MEVLKRFELPSRVVPVWRDLLASHNVVELTKQRHRKDYPAKPGLAYLHFMAAVHKHSCAAAVAASFVPGAAAKHPSVSGTWLGPFLAYLPPVLYSLTLASTYLKIQLPQAAVLHWLTTSSYTLSLQLGLKSPRVRKLLGFTQPNLAAGAGDVDPAVAAQANAMDNADILVVMGAKHAALQRYSEALYCLHRALQLDPQNVR